MATPAITPSPERPRPKEMDTTFTRNLRFEFASEEGRALVGSYAISGALGLLWILLVMFGPRSAPPSLIAEDQAPTVTFVPPDETPAKPPEVVAEAPRSGAERAPSPGPVNKPAGPKGPQKGNPKPGRPGAKTETSSAGAVGDVFGTGSGTGSGGTAGDVSNILRGVAVNSGSGGTGGGSGGSGGGGLGGKTVLGYGQGGQGATTPGRGGIGGGNGTGGGGGGGIGGVGAGGGMTRQAVRVGPPRVITPPPMGGPGRNMDDLGTFVRSREPQLRFCYNEYGLKTNPSLAGSVAVAISITGSGSVSGVDVTGGSLAGSGASSVQSCIKDKIRGWRFPSSSVGEGTYGFSFNFTR